MKRREFVKLFGALPFVGKALVKPAELPEDMRLEKPVVEEWFTLNNKIGSKGHHELKVDGRIDPSEYSAVHAWFMAEAPVEVRLDGMVFKGYLAKIETSISCSGFYSLRITVIGSADKYWNTSRFKRASISSFGFRKIKFTRIEYASVVIDAGIIQYIPEFGDGIMIGRV